MMETPEEKKSISELVFERKGRIDDLIRIMTNLAQQGIKTREFTEAEFNEAVHSVWCTVSQRPDYNAEDNTYLSSLGGPETTKVFALEHVEAELLDEFREISLESYNIAAENFRQKFPGGLPTGCVVSAEEDTRLFIENLMSSEEYSSLRMDTEDFENIEHLVEQLTELARPFEMSDQYTQHYDEYLQALEKECSEAKEANERFIGIKEKWEKRRGIARNLLHQIDKKQEGDSAEDSRDISSTHKTRIGIGDTLHYAVYCVEDRAGQCYRISFLLPINEQSIGTDQFSTLAYVSLVEATSDYGRTVRLQGKDRLTRMDLLYNPDQREQVIQDMGEIVKQTKEGLDKGILGQMGYRIELKNIGEVND
jgi:hypothetical protein